MLPNDNAAAGLVPEGAGTTNGGSAAPATEPEGSENGKASGRSEYDAKAMEARQLRLEQRFDQLTNLLIESMQGEPEQPTGQEAPKRPAGRNLRELIPQQGYEGAQSYHEGVVEAIEELRQELTARKPESGQPSPQNEWRMFKRLNPDWEKLDPAMAEICKATGFVPQTLEQLEAVRDMARDRVEVARLKAELEAAKKSGTVPRMQTPTPTFRGRLRDAKKNVTGMSVADLVVDGLNKARMRPDYSG